jgi:hypothetical protein
MVLAMTGKSQIVRKSGLSAGKGRHGSQMSGFVKPIYNMAAAPQNRIELID